MTTCQQWNTPKFLLFVLSRTKTVFIRRWMESDGQAAKPLLYSLQLYTVTPDCDTSQSSPPKSMTHPHISFQFRATFRIKTAAAVRSWPVTALVMHASLPSPLLSHNSSGGGGGGGAAAARWLLHTRCNLRQRGSQPGAARPAASGFHLNVR